MWETVAALDLYRDRLQPLRSLSRPFTGTTGSAMLYVFMLAQNALARSRRWAAPGPSTLGRGAIWFKTPPMHESDRRGPESRPGP
jgi:hypothetical protein